MNIQQLKYIVAIANNGSFREASKKLFVAQPTLSHAVKELEDELSAKLFVRTNKGANLTEEGVEFVAHAQKILAQFDTLESRYLNEDQKREHFSISSQHYDFLAPILSQLIMEETQYKTFRIFESTTKKIIEDVANFRSELGIIWLSDMNQVPIGRVLEEENIEYETITHFKTHVFLSATHPLAHKESVTEEELREFPQVRFTQQENNYSYFQEDLIVYSPDDRIIHTSDRATLTGILQRTTAYGTGSNLVEDASAQGIKLIPLENSPTNRLCILHPKNKPFTAMAEKFIASLKEYFQTHKEFNKS